MRIAICKGGTNITFSKSNRSAANADILYALRQIDPKAIDVTIVTKKTRNTYIPDVLSFIDINDVDFDAFDIVLLFNFSINFFGGAEDPNLLNLYRKLSKTNTSIIYAQTDGQLPFKQLWPSIQNREWAQSYSESEFFIDPAKVVYLTQGQNLLKVHKEIEKKEDNIKPRGMLHYPWAQTILAGITLAKYEGYKGFDERPYDLAFGGATRNAHKRKKIEKYFTDPMFCNLLFGNLRGILDYPHVTKHKAVSYQNFIPTMKKARGTIIIGDKHYENNYFTLRMYESIIAGCLTYIDRDLDTYMNFYQSKYPELYIDKPSQIMEFDSHAETLAKESTNFILTNYNECTEREKLHAALRDCI